MKRDMDIVRDLLLWMEKQDEGLFVYDMLPPFPNQNSTVEHVQILISGGFIEKYSSGAFRMSWEGHEFLDKVRDERIWRKTKEGASKVGSWSVKLLSEMASGLIRAKAVELGIPLA